MAEIKVTFKPDGTVSVDVEDPSLETCDKESDALLAILALLGVGLEGVSQAPRKDPTALPQGGRNRVGGKG